MPIINYKAALIEKVINGDKPHTIRFGKRIYKVGQTAIHSTGMRTSNYKEHRRDEITKVDKIRIRIDGLKLKIWIDNRSLDGGAAFALIKNDGFHRLSQFVNFFKATYGSDFDLTGQLIHWAKSPINYNHI